MQMDSSLEIDSNSDNEYPTVIHTNGKQLDQELDINKIPWEHPPRLNYISTDPIKDVKVQKVANQTETMLHQGELSSGRYQGLKPLWLIAEISKRHIGKGETTSVSSTLSKIIVARGIHSNSTSESDDCGHVVGASLGGKMVDFNLFPQNKMLNRGWCGNYFIWRVVESCIKLWVTTIPAKYNPRVEFQMLLYYNSETNDAAGQTYPDRPDKFKYMVRFLTDDDPSDDENNDDREKGRIVLSNILLNISSVSLQCKNEGTNELRTTIQNMAAQLSDRCKRHVDQFLEEIFELVREIDYYTAEVPPEPSHGNYRYRNTSALDFLPVVGSVKTLIEGYKDVVDGYPASAAANLVIGTVSLALDVVTIGACSTVVNGLTKAAIKEGAKGAAKQAAIKTFEKTGTAAVVALASNSISNAVKRGKK